MKKKVTKEELEQQAKKQCSECSENCKLKNIRGLCLAFQAKR
jgi:hypothetical protein